MKAFYNLAVGAAAALALVPMGAAAQTLIGPTTYQSAADSPYNGTTFSYSFLEDFQDGFLNTSGLSSPIGAIFTGAPGSLGDSVEFNPDGSSYFRESGISGLNFFFDAAVLGALPTHAGLVWTDGFGLITFEAFDQNGVSLGTVTGNHADSDQTGQKAEDRFYGAINAGGISRIFINNAVGGIEVDHVQYALQGVLPPGGVPEPATWALMIGGFGAVGGAMRRARRRTPTAFA